MENSNFNGTLAEFDAGIFEKKLTRAMQDVVLGVVNNSQKGQKGKVTIELTVSKDTGSDRVEIQHKLTYSKPTMRGKSIEEDTTSTPMYPSRNGSLSLSQENQNEMFDSAGVTRMTK